MQPWTYRSYTESVKSDVEFGRENRKYSLREAIGFAHSELALRLEELPNEAPMALIALAACSVRGEVFGAFKQDDFFVSELHEALKPENLASVENLLSGDEVNEFKEDVQIVTQAL